jgi:2-keto-4-pentenoate hydratase
LNPPPAARDAAALAQALVAVRRRHGQQAAAEWAPALADPAEAYAVQDAVAADLAWFLLAPPAHWKSGGASRDAVLTHAPLPPAGVRTSPALLADWPMHQRGVEAEIALRLGRAVSPAQAAELQADPQPAAIDALIDAMAVTIEVCDSRWLEGTQAPALLRLADLQSHAALALGDWQPYVRRDWAGQRCEVRIGAQQPLVRSGSHSLADPAWLLPQWLRHATRHGHSVAAGTVVTTGTWVGMLPAQPDDAVHVAFDGIGTASLQL